MSAMKNQWIEIFEGGPQTASDGTVVDGDKFIEKALSSFDVKKHEPPAVIGHPEIDKPAYAWVEGLKREGAFLMAKFTDIDPDFENMVEKGRFKKRSAAFYPDGRLKHVGFLGAAPPAVKGLKNISFSTDSNDLVFIFSEEKKKEDNSMPKQFTEADVKATVNSAVKEAVEAVKQKMTVQFAEEQKTAIEKATEEAINKTKNEMAVEFAENQKTKVLQKLFSEKKLTDKEKEVKTFMSSLDNMTAVKFSDEKEQTMFDYFTDFIKSKENSQDPALFSEFKPEESNVPKTAQELDKAVHDYAKKHRIDYAKAFNEMQKESPELFIESE